MNYLRDNNKTVFVASAGPDIGSSGFANYRGCTRGSIRAALDRVFNLYPEAVVVDGSDNWSAPATDRPATYARHLGLTPLAEFHTGISGLSASGVVLSPEDFKTFDTALKIEAPDSRLRVYVKGTPV